MKAYSFDLYLNAFDRTAKAYEVGQGLDPMPFIKKLTIYGVKMINRRPAPYRVTSESAMLDFKFAELILQMIGTLAPLEFMGMFPIEKRYEAQKNGDELNKKPQKNNRLKNRQIEKP